MHYEQMRAIQGEFNRAVSQIFSSNQYSSWNDGLSADQIAKYKNTFNKYIIEEFLVIYKQNLSHAEMLAKLKEADVKFCEEVKALFSAESYQKWQGRRRYDFERRMKLKGITK